MKSIIIRVDSSYQIGSGHLMRCLSVAKMINVDTTFVCRDLPGNMAHLIEENGFELVRIGYSDCGEEMKELPNLFNRESPVDLLLVDHYGLDRKWESMMRAYAKKIMVIDDLADRRHDCDILLDQNYYKEMEARYDGLVPSGCKKWIGPKYALLRDEFRLNRPSKLEKIERVKNILVNFGGSDPKDYCVKLLESIKNNSELFKAYHFKFVLGLSNQSKKQAEELVNTIPNCELMVSTDSMARLMLECDLFIGSSGITSWERACLGVPALVAVSAANQEKIARDGHGLYHHVIDINTSNFPQKLDSLVNDVAYLNTLAKNGFELLAGSSVTQIVSMLQ